MRLWDVNSLLMRHKRPGAMLRVALAEPRGSECEHAGGIAFARQVAQNTASADRKATKHGHNLT